MIDKFSFDWNESESEKKNELPFTSYWWFTSDDFNRTIAPHIVDYGGRFLLFISLILKLFSIT